jgi:hypothetical protein
MHVYTWTETCTQIDSILILHFQGIYQSHFPPTAPQEMAGGNSEDVGEHRSCSSSLGGEFNRYKDHQFHIYFHGNQVVWNLRGSKER